MSRQETFDESIYTAEGGITNNARAVVNDKSKAFIIATLVAINILGTVAMFVQWRTSEREARLLEYYVMELDGKMMASGLIKPPDSWSGKHKEK